LKSDAENLDKRRWKGFPDQEDVESKGRGNTNERDHVHEFPNPLRDRGDRTSCGLKVVRGSPRQLVEHGVEHGKHNRRHLAVCCLELSINIKLFRKKRFNFFFLKMLFVIILHIKYRQNKLKINYILQIMK
tara:strand:+ start:891 stop:1283 length:393 start_codon:yes stop_codon:yes gene_type:complete